VPESSDWHGGAFTPWIAATPAATVSPELNPLYATAIHRLRERVLNGETLAEAMADKHVYPRSFRGMISMGEISVLLPEACGRIAELYHGDVQKYISILTAVGQPIGMFILACFVFVIYSSMFEAIIRIYNLLFDSM